MQTGPWVQGSSPLEYNLAAASLSVMENECTFEWFEEEVMPSLMTGKLKEGSGKEHSSDEALESGCALSTLVPFLGSLSLHLPGRELSRQLGSIFHL